MSHWATNYRKLIVVFVATILSVAFFLFFLDGVGIFGADVQKLAVKVPSELLDDSLSQWTALVCLWVYSIAIALLRNRGDEYVGLAWTSWVWMIAFTSCMLLSSILHGRISTSILICQGGVMMGQSVGLCAKRLGQHKIRCFVTEMVAALLIVGALFTFRPGQVFQYGTEWRWTGPWDNPNIAGLLMGVCLIISIGSGLEALSSKQHGLKRYFTVSCSIVGLVVSSQALMKSYSRGAALGTLCGLLYLLHIRGPRLTSLIHKCRCEGLQACYGPLRIIILTAFVLCCWHFKYTEVRIIHRAFSIFNMHDFSWRNRVTAWEGTLQIIAQSPWCGFGWDQPESVYANLYSPPRLNESAAIQMNDYLLLTASLGIPVLFCFGMYVWLTFANRVVHRDCDWRIAICRASAIVLLCGFWFDGGLFKLPTASAFWILLELGTP